MKNAHILVGIPGGVGKGVYAHCLVALAEGLTEHGWSISSNQPFWRSSAESTHLARKNDRSLKAVLRDCELVLVGDSWWEIASDSAKNELFASKNPSLIYVHEADAGKKDRFFFEKRLASFDVRLKVHGSIHDRFPCQVEPWAFGLTDRIISAAKRYQATRTHSLLSAYFHKAYPHTTRLSFQHEVLPLLAERIGINSQVDSGFEDQSDYEKLMWDQTCGRHRSAYYRRLASVSAVACYGGSFVCPLVFSNSDLGNRLINKCMRRFRIASSRIGQWDSFRLWESFAFGCCPLLPVLEKYGALLPAMPEAGVHYLGLDPVKPSCDAIALLGDRSAIEQIGSQGKAWALEQYSPARGAERMLRMVNMSEGEEENGRAK